MANTASFISQAVTDKFRSFRTTVTNSSTTTFTEYNAAENKLFEKVSTAIEQGKYVGMATKEIKDSNDASGNAGERVKAGMPEIFPSTNWKKAKRFAESLAPEEPTTNMQPMEFFF